MAEYESVDLRMQRWELLYQNDAVIISLLVAGIVASLYFMWSVRHPKEE
jgi:hypothetical protein